MFKPIRVKLVLIACLIAIAPPSRGQENRRRPSNPPPQAPVTPVAPAKPTIPADYVKWEAPDKSFSLSHPKGWEARKTEVPNAPLIFVNLADGEPPADQADELSKRGMLMVLTLPSGSPPKFEAWSDGVKKAVLARADNPSVVEEKAITIANQPAGRIVFDAKVDKDTMRFIVLYFFKGPTAYSLTYTVDPGRYDQFAPVEQAITASFTPGAAHPTVAAGGHGPPALRPTPFEYKDLGLKLTYPAGWGVINIPAKDGLVLSLGKPASAGKQVQSLTILAEALEPKENLTLKEMEAKLSEMTQAGLKNAKVVEATNVKMGGEPARRILFAGIRTADDHEIRMLIAFTIHNRATYGLLAGGPIEDYDALKADFDATLATFAFTSTGAVAADASAKPATPAAPAPGATATPPAAAAGPTAFESPAAGLKLTYPGNWTARKSADPTIVLMLFGPTKPGQRPGTLMVSAEPIAQGDRFNPKTQIDSALATLKASTVPDAKIIENTDLHIGREAARRVLIAGNNPLAKVETRNLYVVFKNANQSITLSGQSTLQDFDSLKETVDAIIASIELSLPKK
jgi:hypothetical protein